MAWWEHLHEEVELEFVAAQRKRGLRRRSGAVAWHGMEELLWWIQHRRRIYQRGYMRERHRMQVKLRTREADRLRQYHAVYRSDQAHKAKHREQAREWYRKNKAKQATRFRDWYASRSESPTCQECGQVLGVRRNAHRSYCGPECREKAYRRRLAARRATW